MTIMQDAVTSANIPADCPIVGGYINGRFIWSVAEWQRFSGLWAPIQVYIPGITVDPVADAKAAVGYVRDVLGLPLGSTIIHDREASDAPFSSRLLKKAHRAYLKLSGHVMRGAGYGVTWASTVRSLGFSPAGYTSLSTAGYLVGYDDLWLAHYTNWPHTLPGAVAVQYASPGPVDLSFVYGNFPRRGAIVPPPPPAPPAPPAPPIVYGDGMIRVDSHIDLGPDGCGFTDVIPPNGLGREDVVGPPVIDWANMAKVGSTDKAYGSVAIGGSDDPTINAPGPYGRVRVGFVNGKPNQFLTFRLNFMERKVGVFKRMAARLRRAK